MGGFEAGDEVGNYRLERKLGEGGMGTVWVALQEGLGRRVALKLLHPTFASDANVVGRFRREAELAASLGHPNIVQVTDFGVHEGRPFLVMDMLEGEALAQRIDAGVLDPEALAFIAAQVLSALEAAHERDVVHRDLKPDNIFLTSMSGVRDIVKLLDFGIARLVDPLGDGKMTSTGQVLGTPAYMSPEQARGGEVDARADLYAVGVVMYEALSGRLPFSGGNYHQLMFAIVDETPPPVAALRPGLPPALVAVVERAMQKDPAARFQTAAQMREALELAVPTRVRGPSAVPPPRRSSDAPGAFAATLATPHEVGALPSLHRPPANRPWGRLALGAGVLLLGAVGTIVAVTASRDVPPTSAVEARVGAAEEVSPPDHNALRAPTTRDDVPVVDDVARDGQRAPDEPSSLVASDATMSSATMSPTTTAAPMPTTVMSAAATSPMATARASQSGRHTTIPCGPERTPREAIVIRPSDNVHVTSLMGNNVVPLGDLRPRVQSPAAAAAFTRCYVGHPLASGQRVDFRVDAAGDVQSVTFWRYCEVEAEVEACVARWLRSVSFQGVVAQPGEMRLGLSR